MKFLLLLFTFSAFGAIDVKYLDLKLPTQKMIETYTVSNAISTSGTGDLYVSGFISGPTSAAALTISSGITNPDVPRNLVITPGGSTARVGNCDIVVAGKSINDTTISETFSFTTSQATSVTGNYAFKSIDSITWPANCESSAYGAWWKFGIGAKIGIPRCMDNAGDVVHTLLGGAKEATGPTMVNDVDEVEKNTATFNGALNGANDFTIYYFQNYRCMP